MIRLLALAAIIAAVEAFALAPSLRPAFSPVSALEAKSDSSSSRAAQQGLEMSTCRRSFNRASFASWQSRASRSSPPRSQASFKQQLAEVPLSLIDGDNASPDPPPVAGRRKERRMD